jgi:hypothetical protein
MLPVSLHGSRALLHKLLFGPDEMDSNHGYQTAFFMSLPSKQLSMIQFLLDAPQR